MPTATNDLGFVPYSPDLGFVPFKEDKDPPSDLGFVPYDAPKPNGLQGGGYEPRETPVNTSPYLADSYGSEFPGAGSASTKEVLQEAQKPFVNVSPKLVRKIIGTPLLEAVLPESVKKGASEELASIASSATSPLGLLVAANAPVLGPLATIAAVPPIVQGTKTISEASKEGDVEKLTRGIIQYTAGVAGVSGLTELAKTSPLTAKALTDTGVKIETPPIIEAAKGTQNAIDQIEQSQQSTGSGLAPSNVGETSTESVPQPEVGPGMVGMGAAVPEESAFQRGQGSPTAMKYRLIDEERAQRGLEPLAKPPGLTDEMAVNKAMAEIDRDPAYPEKLVESIIKDPRAIEDWQNHVLMLRKIDLRNEFEKSAREAAQAYEDGRTEDLVSANARTAEWSDRLSQLEEASRLSGSKRGSALRSLQVMMNEDYSLGSLETQARASKGGKPLTDSERADLIKIADEHKAIADQLQERLAGQEGRIRALENQASLDRLAKESAPSPFILKIAKEINDTIKTSADAARERLRGKTFTLSPEVLKDIALVGADNIRTIGLDFAKWSARMAEDLGESIKPHLAQAWIESQKVYESVKDGLQKKLRVKPSQVEQAANIVTKKTLTEKTAEISDKVRAKTAKGESDISGLVQKLAREFVASGIKERNALVDAVHGVLKDIVPDITREDTSEAISGYGKYKQLSKDEVSKTLRDLKGQLQQVSKLEDMASGEAPKKTGVERRIPSDEERALIKQVNEAKKKGGYNVTDPATQLRSALQSQETRLKNQIADLEHEIATKTRIVREKTQQPTSPEIEALKARRDVLKEEHAKIFEKPGVTEAQRLAWMKTRLKNRISELERKVADQDFSPRPARVPPKMDPEALALQARKNEIELKFKQDLAKNRLEQRTGFEKAQDALAKWRRGFLLSGVNILGKLTAAAITRTVSNIGEAGIGSAVRRIAPDVAAKSDLYGEGLNVRIEAKAIAEGLTQGMRDAWQTLKTGRSQLDVLYGKPELVPPAMIDFFGHLHGFLKAPTKRIAFERSLQFQIEHGIRNGVDVHDRMIQTKFAVEAYKEANRAIFMQDNRVVSAYKRALGALEQPDKLTGKVPTSGKVAATAARVFLPIVKVPSNIVAETFESITGTVSGSAKLAEAVRKGTENLSKEDANLIMRHLAKGSLGGAMLLLGYLNPNNVGGLYQPGEKRKPDDVKFGAARVYGVNIPALMLHNPFFIAMQIGATVRHVQDSYVKKGSGETKGLPEGLMAAGLGLTEEVPFVREAIDFAKIFNPRERQQFLGNLAGSAVPQGLRDVAQFMDRDAQGNPVKRNEKNIVQHVETGIPGLRQNVPVKR